MLSMTISWTSSSLSVLGPRSRSQWLLLEKDCHRSCAFIYGPILILYHTNVKYDNILDKFEFERSSDKVKVTVAIFSKNFVIALVPSFIIQFQYNCTQILGMTIPRTSWRFSTIGSRSRSQ